MDHSMELISLYGNPFSVSENILSLEGISSGRYSFYMRSAVNSAKIEYIFFEYKGKRYKLKHHIDRRPPKINV